MPVLASERRLQWERKYIDAAEANFQLYCVNGHSVGDEKQLSMWEHYNDDFRCPYCHAGKPFLYRWEVD